MWTRVPAANNMFALWPGDRLNFSVFKITTFGFAGQPAASEAGHIANTNVASNIFIEMMTSIIITLSLLGLVGLLKLWEKYQNAEGDKILKRVADITSPSFSLMAVLSKPTIEIKTRLENLIDSADYEIVELKNIKVSFSKWNDKIYFDTKNLKKGIIELSDSIVFNDPESVIITDKEKIEQLCKDLDCKILVAIWERVSMTVMFDEYEFGTLTSTTSVTEDKADKDNIKPNRELLKKADGDKLKIVLMNSGVNIRELLDKDDLNVIEYKLKAR